jgi:hypothetical protein
MEVLITEQTGAVISDVIFQQLLVQGF